MPTLKIKPYLNHLKEFRSRLIYTALFLAATLFAALFFSEKIMIFIKAPLKEMQDVLVYFRPYDKFMAYIKASFFAAVFITVPFALLQLALFIFPALKKNERPAFYALTAAAPVVFIAGCAFSYAVIVPAAVAFFIGFAPGDGIKPFWGVAEYLDMFLALVLLTGAVFELPLPILGLVKAGIIKAEALSKSRKYIIIGILVVAAVITPTPDMVTQLLVSVPMYLLYEATVVIARMIKP